DDSYTICGSYSNMVNHLGPTAGYLVDWNQKTKKLSRWRTYAYNNDLVNGVATYFNGITSDGDGGYYLTGNWNEQYYGTGSGFFAHVRGKRVKWSQIAFPDQMPTSGNSVYKKVVIG